MADLPYDPDAILADPNSHPKHRAIAAINIDIRDNGARWAKCANCGDPYRLTQEWSSGAVCSEQCHQQFAASMYE